PPRRQQDGLDLRAERLPAARQRHRNTRERAVRRRHDPDRRREAALQPGRLRTSSGGSVKNNVVFRPTVVIGLGGTGYNTLLKLKQRFIDVYGNLPPIVKFLSIDTTENAEGGAERDGNEARLEHGEMFVLQVNNPERLVGNGTNPHLDEWWPPEVPTQAITAGAGQVRARGRLALFARAAEVYARLQRTIDEVRAIR